MNVFIGIDPSLNSTGICILKYDENNQLCSDNFYCVKPNKLTKREIKESTLYPNLQYILYEKDDLKEHSDNNVEHEAYKTRNIFNIGDAIATLFSSQLKDIDSHHVYIVMEGISYGSSGRTVSIFDLAGLNYVLRYQLKNFGQLMIGSPKQIKKFATGNGNAGKDEVINIFNSLYSFDIKKIDDISDAYFMAKYAKHLYDTHNVPQIS